MRIVLDLGVGGQQGRAFHAGGGNQDLVGGVIMKGGWQEARPAGDLGRQGHQGEAGNLQRLFNPLTLSSARLELAGIGGGRDNVVLMQDAARKFAERR